MKFSSLFTAAAALISGISAAPHGGWWAPQGGWGAVNWRTFDWSGVNLNRVDWSQVPFTRVDWSKLSNNPNFGNFQFTSAAPLFTSTYAVLGTPGNVVNGTGAAVTPTGGLPGAKAVFQYGIISSTNTICFKIAITGFRGQYQSLARTSTHIHEAPVNTNGPPRIVFPNPILVDTTNPLGKRLSQGCLVGPFTTGILQNGVDTGFGFNVRQIEQNPRGFFTDIHSSLAVPGAVRGQIA